MPEEPLRSAWDFPSGSSPTQAPAWWIELWRTDLPGEGATPGAVVDNEFDLRDEPEPPRRQHPLRNWTLGVLLMAFLAACVVTDLDAWGSPSTAMSGLLLVAVPALLAFAAVRVMLRQAR